MARRRQKPVFDPKIAFGLLITLGVVWVVWQILQQPGVGLVILAGILAVLVYPVARYLGRVNARRVLFQKVHAALEEQTSALVRRRAQLVCQDPYGKPKLENWTREIDYFITHQIEPLLSPKENAVLGRERAIIANVIQARVEAAMQDQPAFQGFRDDMTGAEFEVFCAEELCRVGWNARVTIQSRDQGVDVVAEKGGVRIVLQCKLYAQRPVGNKAVQEAAAGKAHEQASYGVVVTNNRYTSAAEQLASTNGILLLHYRDLPNIDDILASKRSVPSGR